MKKLPLCSLAAAAVWFHGPAIAQSQTARPVAQFTQRAQPTYESLVEQAYSLLRQDRAAAALTSAGKALGINAAGWEALAVAGMAQDQLGNFDAALASLNRALQLAPAAQQADIRAISAQAETDKTYQGMLNVAESQFQSGDYRTAAQSFDQVRHDYPKRTDAAFRAATAWTFAGDTAQARSVLEGILRSFSEPLVLDLAHRLLAVNNASQARKNRDCIFAIHVLDSLRGSLQQTPEWLLEAAQTKLCLGRRDDALADMVALGGKIPGDRGIVNWIAAQTAEKAREEEEQEHQTRQTAARAQIPAAAQAILNSANSIGPVAETKSGSGTGMPSAVVSVPMRYSATAFGSTRNQPDDWDRCMIEFQREGQGISRADHGWQLQTSLTDQWNRSIDQVPGSDILLSDGQLTLRGGFTAGRNTMLRKRDSVASYEVNQHSDWVFHDLNPAFLQYLYNQLLQLQRLCREAKS